MKNTIIVTIITAAVLHGGAGLLKAQESSQPPHGPPRCGEKSGAGRHAPRPWRQLSEEERERLKAAHEKAQSDAKVAAARQDLQDAGKDLHDTLHAALLKADPSLQPVLQKIDQAREERRKNMKGGTPNPFSGAGQPPPAAQNAWHPRGLPRLPDSLTKEEREKFRDAHRKVKDQPEVESAREKVREAVESLRTTVELAMMAADPGVKPILEKLEKNRRGHLHGKGFTRPPGPRADGPGPAPGGPGELDGPPPDEDLW